MKGEYLKPELIDLNHQGGHGQRGCENGSGDTIGCANGNIATGEGCVTGNSGEDT